MFPHFSAHVYYGQTAEWIRKPLGMEVGLSPAETVLHGDPAPLPRRGAQQPPTFRPNALSRIPAGPHFTHNSYCPIGSARRAAVVAILRIITIRLVNIKLTSPLTVCDHVQFRQEVWCMALTCGKSWEKCSTVVAQHSASV